MYQDLTNQEKIRVSDYTVGVKWVYLSMDIVAFLRYPEKKRKLGEFIQTYRGTRANSIYERDDPKPLIKEWVWSLGQLPGFLTRSLLNRGKRSAKPAKPIPNVQKRGSVSGSSGE